MMIFASQTSKDVRAHSGSNVRMAYGRRRENEGRAAALEISRQDDKFREEERRKDVLRIRRNRNNYLSDFDVLKSNYESKIRERPTHICSSCGGLWFAHSVKSYAAETLSRKDSKGSLSRRSVILKIKILIAKSSFRHFPPMFDFLTDLFSTTRKEEESD